MSNMTGLACLTPLDYHLAKPQKAHAGTSCSDSAFHVRQCWPFLNPCCNIIYVNEFGVMKAKTMIMSLHQWWPCIDFFESVWNGLGCRMGFFSLIWTAFIWVLRVKPVTGRNRCDSSHTTLDFWKPLVYPYPIWSPQTWTIWVFSPET